MSEERVTEIDMAATSLLLEKARTELRNEVSLIRDLTFLLSQKTVSLSFAQQKAIDEALRTSFDVIVILAAKYVLAGTELKAAHRP